MRWKTSCRCRVRVVLAKVMPRQVVLDNGGTYELLTLFEDSHWTHNCRPPRHTPAPRQRDRGK